MWRPNVYKFVLDFGDFEKPLRVRIVARNLKQAWHDIAETIGSLSPSPKVVMLEKTEPVDEQISIDELCKIICNG